VFFQKERLKANARKSQENGVTNSSLPTVTKFLPSNPYECIVVKNLQEAGCVATVRFCKRFYKAVCILRSTSILQVTQTITQILKITDTLRQEIPVKYKWSSCMKKVKYVVLSAVQQEQSSSVPTSSYDLTPCDDYLWGSFKDNAHKNNPHTGDKLTLQFPDKNFIQILINYSPVVKHFWKMKEVISNACVNTQQVILHSTVR